MIRGRTVRDIGNSIKVYMFPNEFHKSLTALPHVSAIIQTEAGVIPIYITFLFSILFPTSHVGIHLIGSKSQEQEDILFPCFCFTMLLQRLPACPVHSVVPSLLHHRSRHYRHFLHWLLLLHLWQLSYLAMP